MMIRHLLLNRLDSGLLSSRSREFRFNLVRYFSKNAHKDKPTRSKRRDYIYLAALAPLETFQINPTDKINTNLQMQPNGNNYGQFPNTNQQNLVGNSPVNPFINWNQFCYQLLAKGEVERVIINPNPVNKTVKVILHQDAIVNGHRLPMRQYLLQVPNTDTFENKLREFERSIGIGPGNEIPVIYERNTGLPALLGTAFLIGLLYLFTRNTQIVGPQSIMNKMTKAKFTLVDPASRTTDSASVRFKDVAGLKEAKVEVMEFVDYLKDGEKYLKLGAKMPKGVLLTGPPGCGKTLLAKAVATESNVPFVALSGSDFVEMIGGVGASRVRNLFKMANKLAPCIVYIDEIDSIGQKRAGSSTMGNSEMEQTLNQLLVEMDGMATRKAVILLASTNRAEILDKALLRPGRFDRQILIDLPNLEERKEIFEKYASKIKLNSPGGDFSQRIAQLTPGMSGADLANVCNEAALHAARKDRSWVTPDDIEYAIERVVGGTEKRSNSLSAEERRIIAYHESGHALIGWLLEHTDPVLKVSIVPRTTNILGFAQYLPSDQKLYNKEQLFDRMCMALGGRCAELVKFNHLSTGAQDDLKKVTQMAMSQVKEFGFDSVVGHLSFPKEEMNQFGRRPYSRLLASVIDHRAGVIVREAFERTQEILNKNLDKLNLLAEALLAKEVINSSDMEQLLGPRPFKKNPPTT